MVNNNYPLSITAAIICEDSIADESKLQPYESKADVIKLFHSLKEYFVEVFIITSNPKKYEDIGVDIVREILPGRGPLGSIVSSLLVASCDYIFVLPNDLKPITKDILDDFLKHIKDNDILYLSTDNKIEPKFAIYSKESLNYLEEALFDSTLTLSSIYEVCSRNLKIDTINLKQNVFAK